MAKQDIHNGYLIRYNAGGAMIFLDGSKSLEHKLAAKTEDDALADAKQWIDDMRAERAASRRADNIGAVAEYEQALSVVKPTAGKRRMLVGHRQAEGRRMTAPQLAEAAGWKSHSSANVHYGSMGKAVAELLGLKIEGDDNKAWTGALAEFDEETREWEMHPEVAEALDNLNIRS